MGVTALPFVSLIELKLGSKNNIVYASNFHKTFL